MTNIKIQNKLFSEYFSNPTINNLMIFIVNWISIKEGLSESIKNDGLLNPITVTPKNGHYQIIVGIRRLKACKKTNFRTITSYVIFDKNFSNADIHKITFVENFHRKELRDLEKAYVILKRYEDYGYTGKQAIQGTKTIYNFISTRKLKLQSMEISK